MAVRKSGFLLILFSVFVLSAVLHAGDNNPVFTEFNAIKDYKALTETHIKDAADMIIPQSRAALEKIYQVPADKRNFDNTMLALDNMMDNFYNVYYSVYLMGSVHPGKAVRDQANATRVEFGKFLNEIWLDENLFRAVKEYSQTAEAGKLKGYKKKFLDESLREFRRNGFELSPEQRSTLKEIKDRLTDLSTAFSKNIAEYKDSLVAGEAEIKGLPEDYKKSRKKADNTYVIDMTYPSIFPFMKYSESETARKELMRKFRNRAADKNLTVLKEILIERGKLKDLLGYETFAGFQVETRMAKIPKNVWDFENNLIEKVKVKARQDYDELLVMKRAHTGDDNADVINAWESSFYNTRLLKERYQLDQEKLKEYFELDRVNEGLFKIAQSLFGVTFSEVKNPSVWHEEVRLFEVKQDGNLIGRFYTDFYPRDNKYGHAACFPMVSGKDTENGYQVPTAALVCNFPKPTEERPALLSHAQVNTFFHEFGHVLHNVLTRAELANFSGTSVARDFVEAPSQILENWTWNYDALKMFATHFETNEVLPADLYKKMIAAKNVGSGLNTLQQIFYGLVDFTLHDKFDPNGSESTTEVVKRLQNSITLYPFLDGTHFEANFGHLTGYAAGYYGYLWAKVYAEDMYSVFEEEGIFNKDTGRRFRETILSRGGSVEELQMVKDFLKREPDPTAFFKSLGLNVDQDI